MLLKKNLRSVLFNRVKVKINKPTVFPVINHFNHCSKQTLCACSCIELKASTPERT